MILNERILQTVLALAEELHFGRAALRLHVSQPALSGTLRGLEQDLGVRLFRRTSRHVELTEAGSVFAAEARRLVAEGQRAITLIRNSAPEMEGPLRIAYPGSIDLRWLCSLISAACKDSRFMAGLRWVAESTQLAERLVDRSLQAAFASGRVNHPDLQWTPLFREEFTAVVSARVPHHTFEQLAAEDVVWLRRDVDPLLFDAFSAQCAACGYRPRIVQQVSSFSECLEFARAGVGVTFLPAFLPYQPDTSLRFIPVPEGTLFAEFGLAHHRQARSRELDSFLKLTQQFALKKAPALRLPRIDRPA